MGLKAKTWDIVSALPLTSNQLQTLQIPVFGSIDDVLGMFTTSTGAAATVANIKSEIANIELNINGTPIVSCSPTRLLAAYAALASRVGVPASSAGIVPIYFLHRLFKSPRAQKALMLHSGGINTIQLKVTAGTLATITSVGAKIGRFYADGSKPMTFGPHARLIDYPRTNFTSVGTDNLSTLPTDQDSAYLMALIDQGAGTVSSGQAKINAALSIDTMESFVAAMALSDVGLTQPTGYFVYNWTDGGTLNAAGEISGYEPMLGVTSTQLNTTFSAAPTGGYTVSLATLHGLPQKQ